MPFGGWLWKQKRSLPSLNTIALEPCSVDCRVEILHDEIILVCHSSAVCDGLRFHRGRQSDTLASSDRGRYPTGSRRREK